MEGGQCVREKATCNRPFLGHRSSYKKPRPHTTKPKKHLISDRTIGQVIAILATLLVLSVGAIVSHGREYPFQTVHTVQ